MDSIELDEVQFEDFSVIEEIELDEDGEEVNRILTENIHPYDNEQHIGNGGGEQVYGAQLQDFCDDLVISSDNTYGTMAEESLNHTKWTNFSNKEGESILQQSSSVKQSAPKKGESVLKLSQPTDSMLHSSPPSKTPKTQPTGESLLKLNENQSTVASSKLPDKTIDISGLKVKQFTSAELEAFRKPFDMGWRRELVLRGTVTSSGKKIGDVYYFSPDKSVKLRSYVEMGSYLKKHPDGTLEPENFTFARQPIYEAPYEIVRHANPRSRNESTEDKAKACLEKKRSQKVNEHDTTNHSTKDDNASSGKVSNAKRKRTAPSRFEDEDHYEQSPFKKKAKPIKSESASKTTTKMPNGTSKGTATSSIQSSTSEKTTQEVRPASGYIITRKSTTSTENLAKVASPQNSQLESPKQSTSPLTTNHSNSLAQEGLVSEGPLPQTPTEMKKEVGQDQVNNEPTASPVEAKSPKRENDQNTPQPASVNQKSEKPKKSKNGDTKEKEKRKRKTKTKSDKGEKPKDGDKSKTEKIDLSVAEDVLSSIPLVPPAPCSIMCNGKKGILPNLLCGRCLCLYHPECVPTGIYLDDPHRFICPNCIDPSDFDKQVTPLSASNLGGNLNADIDFLTDQKPSRGGSIKGSHFLGPSSNPKHHPLNELNTYPSQFDHLSSYKSKHSSSFNNLYRFTGISDHHFPTQRLRPSRIDNHRFPPYTSNFPLLGLNSLSIAPIAPIKYSPNQVAEILQEQLNKQRSKILRVKPEIFNLTNGYECLLHVFQHLNVRDLVRVKQVSRTFNLLASHSSLWRRIKLKGLVIKDWEYFGRNIIESGHVEEIDFEGIRCPQGCEPHEMWSNFNSILENLKCVKTLRFGTVPKSIIETIICSAANGEPFYSFSNLETLHVRNLCHDDISNRPCSLSILSEMENLLALKHLKLDCKFGLSIQDDADSKVLEVAFSKLSNLHSLSITTLKGLDVKQFSFMKHLVNVKNLEIGSCDCWTNIDDNNTNVMVSSSFENNNSNTNSIRDGFSYLSQLTQLRRLKLCDVIIDETSNQLSSSLNKMINLRHLCLQGLTISPDASQTLESLCSVIKSHLTNLRYLTIASSDPHTNKCVFELIKKLDTLDIITWKVNANVEDSGECLVPFLKERGEESDMELDNVDLLCGGDDLEMMEINCLNNLLQSHSPHTHVEILPQ